jgi:tetratricopeptide (TPR) repeat protein
MCKPMIVTLPCLLLLLDYWPLQRLKFSNGDTARNGIRLALEKIPFFSLSAAGCLVTLAAQHAGGAVKNTQEVSLAMRAMGALSAYAQYVYQTFWPDPLCIFYPIPEHLPMVAAIFGALLLIGGSVLAIRTRKNCPWLITGWLWFIGSLVPVIGLIQVGLQAHADRYTYIPSIGLYIALVWSIHHWLMALNSATQPTIKKVGIALATTCLVACIAVTEHQLTYWQDNVKLFAHSLAHTRNNAFAQNNLGVAFAHLGQTREAIVHYREAIQLDAKDARAYYNLGTLQAGEGDLNAAGETLSQALRYSPQNESLLNNLGVVQAQQGKYEEALDHFQKAILYNPAYPKSYLNAAVALQALGKAGPAFTNYTIALRMEPGSIETLRHLAYLLATCPDTSYRQPQQAILLANRAAILSGNFVPECLQTLAVTYAANSQYSNAVAVNEKALTIAKARCATNLVARLESELQAYRAGKNPERDWKRVQ